MRFKEDDLDVELARDCAGKAWHLCDHVFMALGTNSGFGRLGKLQEHVREVCPELAYLQDVCTETKHGEIARYRPRIVEARFHGGAFSRDFSSEDFDTSRLEIVLGEGRFASGDVGGLPGRKVDWNGRRWRKSGRLPKRGQVAGRGMDRLQIRH